MFSMYTGLSEEDTRLHTASDWVTVGTVDFYADDRDGNQMYSKEDMFLVNTMNGYVIQDAAGQEFGWVYPVGGTQVLMFQPFGSDKYHSMFLTYSYANEAG